MKKISIILVLGCITFSTYAQNCSDADLDNVPGTWKPGIKSSIGISGADLEKAKSVTTIVDNMMRPGFQVPKGLVATYFAAYLEFNQYMGNNLAQYDYTDWFNHYMCYNNKPRVNPDAQVVLRISFNDPGVLFTHDAIVGEWEANEKDHFGWLDNFPEQKNGIIYMKATPDSAHFTRKPDRWLIAYDGKLPYAYVSRLEYLQKLKTKLLQSIKKGADDIKRNNPIRPKAEQEKEKQEALKKFKEDAANGKGDWSGRYLQNYRSDEQKQEANIKSITEMYQKPLQIVEAHLKKPEKELQQTAIINWNHEFDGFINEGDVGAVILVKENPDYFNKKLSKAVPQIIFVSLSRYDGSKKENYVSVYHEIIKRLDLQKLQGMLGK
ncbi:MAG: hypothetical protein ABIN48_02820 [Ginsengibacter sp.]